jgi:hypothetical protein
MSLNTLGVAVIIDATEEALTTHRASLDGPFATVRDEFEAVLPTLKALVPQPRDPKVAELAGQAKRHNDGLDRFIRGTWTLLEGLAELEAEGRGADLLRLRDHLFPDGLRMTLRSNGEQAADAMTAPERLDEADLALLREVGLLGGRSALDAYEEWRRTGHELARIERERRALDEGATSEPTAGNVAKNRWIRAVRGLEWLVETRGLASHPVLDVIRGWEAKAAARHAGQERTAAEPEAPIPA